MTGFPAPLRLRLDGDALLSNWRWLAGQGGNAACGAAIKADGYGLGAAQVMRRLADAGCRDFFVSNWNEAAALGRPDDGVTIAVLHGVREEDMARARAGLARPVLSTPHQIARWKAAGGGACDVMIDTGMNRLGLDWRADVAALTRGLQIDTLMSHLVASDEVSPLNALQRDRFAAIAATIPARRYSLANSGGICLGQDYAFDLTRPGLALYGGVPRPGVTAIRPVVTPQAQVLQRRRVIAGDTIGYNATFTATADMEVAILNLGYADGYLRAFSDRGAVLLDGARLPVIGRVSMDLTAIDVTARPDIEEGDWLDIEYDLTAASTATGLSQYELLTGLGSRYDRVWS
jgi:alanine racemase